MMAFSKSQRWTALAFGVVTHAVFVVSLIVMFVSLYSGLSKAWWHFPRMGGWVSNLLLMAQFAIGHSWLLSDKGRRFMANLIPLGLGQSLITTLYAAIASLQLLILFLFWSPSQILWSAPEGWVYSILTGCYVGSWLLLLKAMKDAGLEIQLGYLGWVSVWAGKGPVYKPFARSGLFKRSRQPIYLAFTLILWSAPTWTPDHLLLAIVLTAYCVVAPLLKEKRYLRWYGSAFQRYQARVPYWIPGQTIKEGRNAPTTVPIDYEVVIVGGGPVGLLLAALLGSRKIRVLVLEMRTEKTQWSQAIGITPPSLDILAQLNLAEAFVARGVPIHECRVHGETGYLGSVSFGKLQGHHQYVLSLPQMITMELLEQEVARHASVTVRRGIEVLAEQQAPTHVTLQCQPVDGETFDLRAAYAVACDGSRSRMRDLLNIRTHTKSYGCHFVMGDFLDFSHLGSEAHLFFTADGAVESFPLPDQKRRWIVQTQALVTHSEFGLISQLVQGRTGMTLDPQSQLNQNAFSPRRLDCEVFHDGRVLLCGDAAHVMSPIGGQGMNTGFADADLAAEALVGVLRRGAMAEQVFESYSTARRRVADSAATRAALGMKLGIWTGRSRSLFRDFLFRYLIFAPPLERSVARWFAMRSLPTSSARTTLAPTAS